MPAGHDSEQLALMLEHRERLAREDFFEGPSNAAAIALVERWPDWPDNMVVLVGPEGAGKTHLAAIWATTANAPRIEAATLIHADVPNLLDTGALVLENVVPGTFDETTLFHLLNLARQERAFVLLTARSLPAGWRMATKDLASRLRALPVVTLASPDDALLRAIMVKLWRDRQIAVDDDVVSYVANRIERSVAAAKAAVDALDRESLRQGRPVTRVLAAELLRDRDQPDLFGEEESTGIG